MFQCQDKDGIKVVCSKDTWENHIVAEHPEVQGWEGYAKATIEKPYQIYQDGRHPNTKNYYRPFILPKPYNQQYFRVGVKYRTKRLSGRLVGYVSTAFPCINKRKGDILIWEEK